MKGRIRKAQGTGLRAQRKKRRAQGTGQRGMDDGMHGLFRNSPR